MNKKQQSKVFGYLVHGVGLSIVVLTLAIGIFLFYQGSFTFTKFHHSIFEFLFSANWDPVDSVTGGGKVGASVYLVGTLYTCGLALLFCVPIGLMTAIFMSEVSKEIGQKWIRSALEIYVSIPSVVYGWLGLTLVVPWIKHTFDVQMGGFSVLAAGIVLAIMIFPTMTSLMADALLAVSNQEKEAAYGLGATSLQVIWQVMLPSAKNGLFVGVIMGLTRAFGEALAVAMVIGKTRWFADSIFSPTTNLTSAIAADMGNSAPGGEYHMALWTMALLLYLISIVCIFICRKMAHRGNEQ